MQNIIYLSAFTVFQALCSTLTALLIGLPAAFFTAKRNFIGKKFLLSLSSVPFCVPSLLIALAFVSCFGISGLLNSIIKFFAPDNYSPVALLYSFSGIIIAQGFYNFPLVMKSINDSWKQIPEETAETARLLGAGEWKVFRTITIHQLMPSIASSCMLVFLYCYFSFMIILLFGSVGCSTLEVEVYKAAKITLDFKYAFYLGSLETLLACIFVAFYSLLENKSFKIQGQTFSNHSAAANISSLSEKFFAFIIFSLIFVFFIAPLLSILYNAVSSKNDFLTLKNISHIIQMKGFFKALFTTFFCAVSTGFCSSVLAFLYAVYIRTKDPFSKNLFFRILPMIPLAVSGVILGILITVIVRKGNIILLI
ncbi:ABC transporter permease, partial [Treponema sp.]|uniref:ABC transporter permease n=1 Tax=Treponema sp. TaxID=166 RepID=UPI00388E5696